MSRLQTELLPETLFDRLTHIIDTGFTSQTRSDLEELSNHLCKQVDKCEYLLSIDPDNEILDQNYMTLLQLSCFLMLLLTTEADAA